MSLGKSLNEGRIQPDTGMEEYRVEWVIDISAESHEQAAQFAHKIMLDPRSTATIFFVEGPGDCGKAKTVEIETQESEQ